MGDVSESTTRIELEAQIAVRFPVSLQILDAVFQPDFVGFQEAIELGFRSPGGAEAELSKAFARGRLPERGPRKRFRESSRPGAVRAAESSSGMSSVTWVTT
jgi:hypothetical protein